MIALDTTAIIDLFRGDEKLRQVLEQISESLTTTLMNYSEIFFGIDVSEQRYAEEIEYYNLFFDEMIPLGLTTSSAKRASSMYWELAKSGKTISKFDCFIAAILLDNGVKKIVTRNKKHFERITEMKVIYY